MNFTPEKFMGWTSPHPFILRGEFYLTNGTGVKFTPLILLRGEFNPTNETGVKFTPGF